MMREIYTPALSSHAIERFQERVGPATPAQIEAFILTGEMRQWLAWGATRILHYKGMTLVADLGTIVTIMAADQTWGQSRRNYMDYHPDRERAHG